MGFFTKQLQCGCVEVTSTLEKEPKTFTLSYCKTHKLPDFTPKEKPTETEKEKKSERRILNSNGDTS